MLITLRENSKAIGSSAYWGDHGDWVIALAIHRDSGALSRSNWRVMQKLLGAIDADALHIERFSHWAVGWCDYLLVRPDAALVLAELMLLNERLDGYPVLDESDWSDEEQQEADETWRNCYNAADRAKYVRAHRSQFEFRGLRDAVACLRGDYFAGYASELISR